MPSGASPMEAPWERADNIIVRRGGMFPEERRSGPGVCERRPGAREAMYVPNRLSEPLQRSGSNSPLSNALDAAGGCGRRSSGRPRGVRGAVGAAQRPSHGDVGRRHRVPHLGAGALRSTQRNLTLREKGALVPALLRLSSPDFADGEPIPERSSKDGGNAIPILEWTTPPEGAELAILCDDPDTPVGTWVHWVAAGIDPQTRRIEGQLPGGAVEGANDFKESGYGGPQPPPGDGVHRTISTSTPCGSPAGSPPGTPRRPSPRGHRQGAGQGPADRNL